MGEMRGGAKMGGGEMGGCAVEELVGGRVGGDEIKS